MLKNKKLQAWVEQMQTLCQPENVVICDGSKSEYDDMWDLLVSSGSANRVHTGHKVACLAELVKHRLANPGHDMHVGHNIG